MNSRTRSLTRAALFAALLAVSSYIRIPLGPVPLTLQTAVVLIAGYSLGGKTAAAATLLYTAIGLSGLPVFTSGGGPAYVMSPTFGYIVGFTLSAMLTGWLARFNTRDNVPVAYLLMLCGLMAIYIPGLLWLIISMQWISATPPALDTLVKMGLLIPLPGDLITTVPAAFVSVRLRKILLRQ